MNPASRPSSSLGRTLARGGAVVLALSVLAWFIYDAQQRANERARQSEAAEPQGEMPAALPSSKSLAIELEDGFLPSSKFRALPQGEGEIPTALSSSKGIVIDETTFLHGSKSGVIVQDPPVEPPAELPPVLLPSSKSTIITPPRKNSKNSKNSKN